MRGSTSQVNCPEWRLRAIQSGRIRNGERGVGVSSQHKRPDPQRMSQDIMDSHWRWGHGSGAGHRRCFANHARRSHQAASWVARRRTPPPPSCCGACVPPPRTRRAPHLAGAGTHGKRGETSTALIYRGARACALLSTRNRRPLPRKFCHSDTAIPEEAKKDGRRR